MYRLVHLFCRDEEMCVALSDACNDRGLRPMPGQSVEALLDRSPESRLCLVAWVADGQAARELMRRFEARNDDLVVLIAGKAELADAVEVMRAGAIHFLTDPADPGVIADAVARALQQEARRRREQMRANEAAARIAQLTAREHDVLLGLMQGHSNKTIAHHLRLSVRTVEAYRAHLMERLRVKSLPEALRLAFEAGLLDQLGDDTIAA